MRVALFTETFLPKVDGVVNTLLHLLDHLEMRGHEALLFAPEGAPRRYGRTRVIEVPAMSVPGYGELKLGYPWHRGTVRARLEGFEPDVVHLLAPVATGLVGLRQARRLGLPIVSSFHADLPGFARHWGLGALAPALTRGLRWIHNRTDVTLAASATNAAELERLGFDNVGIWSRGVDTALYNPGRRSAEWRERLTGGHPKAPLLLYAGRLSPEKRVSWIRRAMESLPEFRLAVVGDGPARAELEATLPASRTVFTGWLSNEDLASAYASADAFVFPGANETFGTVVLEAMASGLPVIVPDRGGVLDFVADGETGLLFDSEEPAALARAVLRLARDEALWQRLRRRSREVALGCSWEDSLDDLIETYYQAAEIGEMRQAAFRRAA